MTYQKYYNIRGMLLIDILVALSVGALFVAVLFEASATARQLFVWSRERQEFMNVYEAHTDYFQGMFPYETRTLSVPRSDLGTIELAGVARWFGNDRIETEVTIDNRITFHSVRSYPFSGRGESAHTPICSVDFSGRQNYAGGNSTGNDLGRIQITPILLPGISGELTDIEVRNNRAYVAINSSRVADPDIAVFDISSTTSATLLSKLHTGPGINSISLVGNHIWAATDSTSAQLHVLVLDPTQAISLERTYTLARPSTTTPPTVASVIFVSNNLIYLGTEKWQGSEFIALDISDPANIVPRGVLEIGGKVTDIYVRHGIAYVTTAAQHQVISVDIQDPDHPTILETFDPLGWARQEGNAISFFEDVLDVGRTSGGFDVVTQHELFSWATATTSGLNGSVTSRNMIGGVYGIVRDRLHTFVASRESGKELYVFGKDISQAPIATYPVPVLAQTLTCDNDRLYILDASSPTLYEIYFK